MIATEEEKLGISDLLLREEQNIPVLHQLARSITKNVCDIASSQEALDYVYTHINDTPALLNKRCITKEILFKYLHKRKVPVTADFTKAILVNKVIEYWNNNGNTQATTTSSTHDEMRLQNPATNSNVPAEQTLYPIHLLARKFSEWFFENYNKSNLKLEDFWSDAHLQLRIAATDSMSDNQCSGADCVIDALMQSKLQFGFYFNPNLTHAGVQGRMDVHGLVLVLICGTLHTQESCVGVFECTFGLLRDPFAENNWKVKTIQCVLRSQTEPHVPSLNESDTLRDALSLPVPMGEFT